MTISLRKYGNKNLKNNSNKNTRSHAQEEKNGDKVQNTKYQKDIKTKNETAVKQENEDHTKNNSNTEYKLPSSKEEKLILETREYIEDLKHSNIELNTSFNPNPMDNKAIEKNIYKKIDETKLSCNSLIRSNRKFMNAKLKQNIGNAYDAFFFDSINVSENNIRLPKKKSKKAKNYDFNFD
ncbi:hypothetical protein [Apilactobacillus timberlakei]|uniref:hypothetical protein n=1 Tax=Apilactobacillus timberlakei TaxID=2008380 RepID=UPI00112936F6|nr:hypothetical protein [Apilactobacillus timberlakei]TPR21585.1 hypothetical protein DY083_06065 [Apilactobacillus timberlakei]